ncbi:unnamed protein product [Citrullus colocynthis]|uniref:Uncharacterized protein n=1 Tax=Citrullus colocynthis TaxID=252529 RepID=A0ABP0Z219_9ROSI
MDPISKAPFIQVISLEEVNPSELGLYNIQIKKWKNGPKESSTPGDIFILSNIKPNVVSDLQRIGKTWTFTSFFPNKDDNDNNNEITWSALHMNNKNNSSIFNQILSSNNNKNNSSSNRHCNECDELLSNTSTLFSMLNESQVKAIGSCLKTISCENKCGIELIWGPPGTGKTMLVEILLFQLLRNQTVACAPTNTAIMQLASKFLLLVKEMHEKKCGSEGMFCCLGDILLFGNKSKLKVGFADKYMFLDYRVERLQKCFNPFTGWRHCFASMVDFLEDCVLQFQDIDDDDMSFLEFVKQGLESSHCRFEIVSRSFALMFRGNYVCGSLFTKHEELLKTRNDCIAVLKSLQQSLDFLGLRQTTNKGTIVDFCFQNASLFFCTVSSSFKLHSKSLEPLKALVIDEAAQLKECESVIPMHLADIKHAILTGDECQLPAMVESKVSDGAGFGRSLFERLSSLGHPKHLLNVQYRMHPSISLFPNSKFYSSLTSDGPKSKPKPMRRHFFPDRCLVRILS